MKRYLLMTLLLLPGCLAPELFASEQDKEELVRVDSVLASVNGEPVSLLDVVDESGNEEARLRMIFSGEQLQGKIKELRRSVLEEIINRKLIVGDYYNDPFDIPRQFIENALDEMSGQVAGGTRKSLQRRIREAGITLDNLEEKTRRRVIVEFMLGNLFFKDVSVTPREVYEYYQNNQHLFSAPSTIRLEVIFISRSRENVEELLTEISGDLESGNEKIFKSLVVLYSEAPNAKTGGDLGWIEKDKLRPEFAAVLENAAADDLRGPVTTPEGYYFLRVAGVADGGTKPYAQVVRQLEEQLKRESRKEAYMNYINQLRAKALIRYYLD